MLGDLPPRGLPLQEGIPPTARGKPLRGLHSNGGIPPRLKGVYPPGEIYELGGAGFSVFPIFCE